MFRSISSLIVDAGGTKYEELWTDIFIESTKSSQSIAKAYPSLANKINLFDFQGFDKGLIKKAISSCKNSDEIKFELTKLFHLDKPFDSSSYYLCASINNITIRSMFDSYYDVIALYFFRNLIHFNCQLPFIIDELIQEKLDNLPIFSNAYKLISIMGQLDDTHFNKFMICLGETYSVLRPKIRALFQTKNQKIILALLTFFSNLTKLMNLELELSLTLTTDIASMTLFEFLQVIKGDLFVPEYIAPIKSILEVFINKIDYIENTNMIFDCAHFLIRNIPTYTNINKLDLMSSANICLDIIIKRSQGKNITPKYLDNIIEYACWVITVFPDAFEPKPYTCEDASTRKLPEKIPNVSNDRLTKIARALSTMTKESKTDPDCISILLSKSSISQQELKKKQAYYGFQLDIMKELNPNIVTSFVSLNFPFLNDSIFPIEHNASDDNMQISTLKFIEKCFQNTKYREPIFNILTQMISENHRERFVSFAPLLNTLLISVPSFSSDFVGHKIFSLFVDFAKENNEIFNFICQMTESSPDITLTSQAMVEFLLTNVRYKVRRAPAINCLFKGLSLSTNNIMHTPIAFSIISAISDSFTSLTNIDEVYAVSIIDLITKSIPKIAENIIMQIMDTELFDAFASFVLKDPSEQAILSLINCLIELSRRSPKVLHKFTRPSNRIYSKLDQLLDAPIDFSLTDSLVALATAGAEPNSIRNPRVLSLIMKWASGREDEESIHMQILKWSVGSLNDIFAVSFGGIADQVLERSICGPPGTRDAMRDVYFKIANENFTERSFESLIRACRVVESPSAHFALFKGSQAPSARPRAFLHFTGDDSGVWPFSVTLEGAISVNLTVCLDISSDTRCDTLFELMGDGVSVLCMLRNSRVVLKSGFEEVTFGSTIISRDWCFLNVSISGSMATVQVSGECESLELSGMNLVGDFMFSFGRPTPISDCLYANCSEITVTSGTNMWSISPQAVNDFDITVGNTSTQILATAIPLAITSRDLIISVDNIFKILALLERLEGCENCRESTEACQKCKALSAKEGVLLLARMLYTFMLCSDDDRIDALGDKKFPKLLSAYLMRMKPCFFTESLFADLIKLIPQQDCPFRTDIVKYVFLNFPLLTKFPEAVLINYLSTTNANILAALKTFENYNFLMAQIVNYSSHPLSEKFWDFAYNIIKEIPGIQPRWIFSLFISHQDQKVVSKLYKLCEIVFMKKQIADNGLSILNNETFMPLAISLSKKDPDMHFRTFSFFQILLEEQRAKRLVSSQQLNVLAWKSTVFMYRNIIEHMELLPKLIDTYKWLIFRKNGAIYSSVFFSLYVLVTVMAGKTANLLREINDSIFMFRDGIRILNNNRMMFPLLFVMWDGNAEIQMLMLSIITNLVYSGTVVDLKQFLMYAYSVSFARGMDARELIRAVAGDLMQEACLNNSIIQPESIMWLYIVHSFFDIKKIGERHRDTFLDYITDYPKSILQFDKEYDFSVSFRMSLKDSNWTEEQLAISYIGILKLVGDITIKITSELTTNSLMIAAYSAAMLIKMCSVDFDFGAFVDIIVPLLEKTDPLNAHRAASIVLQAIQSSNNNYPQAMSLEFFTLHYMDSDDSPHLQMFFFEDSLDKGSQTLKDELTRAMKMAVNDYLNILSDNLEVPLSLHEPKPFCEVTAGYEEFSKKSAMIFENGNEELQWMKESSETFLKNHRARLEITPGPFFSSETPVTTKVISQVLKGKQSLTGIKLPPNDPPFIELPNYNAVFASSGTLCGPTTVYEGAILITDKSLYFNGKNSISDQKALVIPISNIDFVVVSKKGSQTYSNIITRDRHYLFTFIDRQYASIITTLESINVEVNEEADPVIKTLRETSIFGEAGTDLINRANLEELFNERKISAYDVLLYVNILDGRSFDDLGFHVCFPIPLKSDATTITEETINMDMAEPLSSQAAEAFYRMDASKYIDGHMDVPPHFFTAPQTHQNWKFAMLCRQALESPLFEPMLIKWVKSTFGIEFNLNRVPLPQDEEISEKAFPASINHVKCGVVAGSNIIQQFGVGDTVRTQFVIGDLFSACDDFFVTANAYENFLHIGNIEEGKELCSLSLRSPAQIVTADHNMIACVSSDSSITVFERRYGEWKEHQVTQYQIDTIESIAISSECGLIASISADKSLICEQALKKRFLAYVNLEKINTDFRPDDGLPALLIVSESGIVVVVERSKLLNKSKLIALSSCGHVIASSNINYFVEKIEIFEKFGEESIIVASVCTPDGPSLIEISLISFDIIRMIKFEMKSTSKIPPRFSFISGRKQIFFAEGQLLRTQNI